MDRNQAERIAAFYVRRDLSIIPIHRPGQSLYRGMPADKIGKIPYLNCQPYSYTSAYSARAGAESIADWLVSGHNLAIVTGPISGVVVVDLDGQAALDWARSQLQGTPWRVNTSKGQHWFYKHPGEPVSTRSRVLDTSLIGVDIRGDRGGYVVCPPSLHATGFQYAPDGDWRALKHDLPLFPLELFRSRSEGLPGPSRSLVNDGLELRLKRARRYLAKAGPAVQGQGGDCKTFQLAAWLTVDPLGPRLEASRALDVLMEWNSSCDPPWRVTELERKIISAERTSKNAR